MNELPDALLPTLFRNQPLRTQKKRTYQGSGIRSQTPKDGIFAAIKTAIQHYGMVSDSENLAKLVAGMVGIENMNVEYLAAALFLYSTYREYFPENSTNKASKITPDMFEDNTSAMKKINARLEAISRSAVPKKDIWPARKVNILTYLYAILIHRSGTHVDFKPSEAYRWQAEKQKKEQEEEEEEISEDAEEEEEELPEQPEDDGDISYAPSDF